MLQFTWTLLLLVAWLLLADAIGARVPLSPRVAALLFGIGLAAVFATPLIFLAYDVTSVEHHRLQTWLMRFGGGLAIAPVAVAVIWALLRRRGERRAPLDARTRPLFAALVASIVAVRRRRPDRLRDPRQQREDPGALPRLRSSA